MLTPTNDFRTLATTMEDKTSTICFNANGFGTHEGTSGFSKSSLRHTISFYRREGIGIRVALGALIGSDRVSRLGRDIEHVYGDNTSTLVLRSLNILHIMGSVYPSVRLRTSARVSIKALSNVHALTSLKFSETILPHRLSGSRVGCLYRGSPVRLRVFIRKTLYVYISKRYLLDTFLKSQDNGHNLYTRPYQLPFTTRGKAKRSLDLGSLSLVRCTPVLSGAKVSSFGVRNEVGHPRCITTTIATLGGSLAKRCSDRGSRSLYSLFSHSKFAGKCCRGTLNEGVFNFHRGRGMASTATSLLGGCRHVCRGRHTICEIRFILSIGSSGGVDLATSTGSLDIAILSRDLPRGTMGEPFAGRRTLLELGGYNKAMFSFNSTSVYVSSNLDISTTRVGTLHERTLLHLTSGLGRQTPCHVGGTGVVFQGHGPGGGPRACVSFHSASTVPQGTRYSGLFVPLCSGPRLFRGCSTNTILPENVFNVFSRVIRELVGDNTECTLYGALSSITTTGGTNIRVVNKPFLGVFGSISLCRVRGLKTTRYILSCRVALGRLATLRKRYQHNIYICNEMPLVLAEGYPMGGKGDYHRYNKGSFLHSEGNVRFPIHYAGKFSRLFGSEPVCVTSEVDRIGGTSFILLRFAARSGRRVDSILGTCRGNSSPSFRFAHKLLCHNIRWAREVFCIWGLGQDHGAVHLN